jgi:hypothetical protein
MIRLSPAARKHRGGVSHDICEATTSRLINHIFRQNTLEAVVMNSQRTAALFLFFAASLTAPYAWAQGAVQAVRAQAELLQTDGWQSLFDGQSLDDWTASEDKNSSKVVDGAIVVGGAERSHLFYSGEVGDHDFKNFQLKLKVMTEPNANSGVYFHTKYQEEGWPDQGYEVQVNNTQSDPRKTGSLYGVKDVTQAPAKDNEWFDLLVTVEGDHVTVAVNGETVVDFTDTGDDMPHLKEFPGRKIGSGTIALQAHDPGSIVHYKDIQIRLLP